jgi:hypothetical protein
LNVSQLLGDDQRAGDETYGYGKLKNDEYFSDSRSSILELRLVFESLSRLERRQKQRGITSGE